MLKLEIEVDINTDIHPMQEGTFHALVLANSLTADGSEDFDLFRHTTSPAMGGAEQSSLIDQYQYVMNGKIFED